MTQDEIIEMARDSGMELYGLGKNRARFVYHLEAFAQLVAAKEREAFKKICDEVINSGRDGAEEVDHNNNENYEGYDDGWFDACNTVKFFVKKQG